MTINELITLAKNGKLKNMAISTDTATILGFINLGLVELYKRFPLRTEEQLIELHSGQTDYELPTDFMWPIAAYEEVVTSATEYEVVEVPINVEDDERSINVVSWNTIQIPSAIDGGYISLVYAASVEKLFTEADLEDTLPLPPQMYEALLEFVAYQANDTLNRTGEQESMSNYNKFEASCARIELKGMYSAEDVDMKNRNMRGFV